MPDTAAAAAALRQLHCEVDNALACEDTCVEVNTHALKLALAETTRLADELDCAQSSLDQAATRAIDLKQRVAELEAENQRLTENLNLAVAQMGALTRGG